MILEQFEIVSARSSRFTVRLFDTSDAMNQQVYRETGAPMMPGSAGMFVGRPFDFDNPQRNLGTINLCTESLEINYVTHECVHAAMHQYVAHWIKWESRARVHMAADNEPIAYLIGEMVEKVTVKLGQRGHPVTIPEQVPARGVILTTEQRDYPAEMYT